jgi:hypothetical protein
MNTMMYHSITVVALLLVASLAHAQPVKVELAKTDAGYQLLRAGQPYFIEGAGGDASKELLKRLGGNSFRTWGVGPDTQKQLDEAHRLGLTVAVGFWLGHERHGFDYTDEQAVARQFEQYKEAVLKYKDHPAVLMWSIGNEMEGYDAGNNPRIWAAVQEIAAMCKQLDPNHPTMTVIAEVGGEKVPSVHKWCPDIDIVGINSYAGGPSLAERYRKAGGTKPFIVTEFGPPGTWEVATNGWGVPLEPTSTAKADSYRATYEKTVLAEKGKLSLGSYAFAWGSKQEATATWFGLLLPGGQRLEATDTLSELWSGQKPANRCPVIQPLKVDGLPRVKPGEIVRVSADIKDPEGDKLRIEWKLTKDLAQYHTGGDAVAAPPSFPEAIVNQGEKTVEIRMPEHGGGYFLYCFAYDDHNGAAVANAPLFVTGGSDFKSAAPKANVPLAVYGDGVTSGYIPSGWMGNAAAVAMDEKHTINAKEGATCLKVDYRAADNWAGVVWQSPANDWGDAPGGHNLTGAKKLTFWARGEQGGEKVNFLVGIIGSEKKYPDSDKAELKDVTLTKDWQPYSIDLEGKDLTQIKTAFGWTLAGQGKPVTFYLDEIRFE